MADRDYTKTITPEQLKRLSTDEQREIMEKWFRAKYEDPAIRTPYDSEEGYVWISGRPVRSR